MELVDADLVEARDETSLLKPTRLPYIVQKLVELVLGYMEMSEGNRENRQV